MKRLFGDFGVRALLAVIALACYEAIIVALLILLAIKGTLDVEGALTIAGLAQSPAMVAITFYFSAKSEKPTDTTPTTQDSIKPKMTETTQ